MSENQKQDIVRDVKGLAKWFSVDVTIKVFGVKVWEYHFPPKS